ncbi:MAG: hypothetical protein ACRYF4_12560 [Janthinobacterium lividum]
MRLPLYLLLLVPPCAAQSIAVGTTLHTGSTAPRTSNPVTMVFERMQTQTLADGTHVSSTTHERFWRDAAGRTRFDRESVMPSQSGAVVTMVLVQDPVARFILHWQTGLASTSQHQFTSLDMDEIPHAPRPRARPDAEGSDVPIPQLQRAPATPQRQLDEQPKPKNTVEKFGVQQVQGEPCEASRITTVYPVGSMGNDRVLTTIAERCVSHEFGRALREVVQDPRYGSRTLMLQSITRGEPDPMLFHPPADYAEKSQTP